MAAVLNGTPQVVTWAGGADPAAQNITVPADTTAVLMFWTYFYNGSPDIVSTTLATGAPDESHSLAGTSTEATCGVAVWYNTGTGSQSLDVEWSDSPTYGSVCIVAYVKGIDTTGWRDVDTDSGDSGGAVSVTIDSNTDDLVLKFDVKDGAPPSTSAGWTSEQTTTNNSDGANLSSCDSPGAVSTVCDGEDESYSSVTAVSLKVSAATPSASPSGSPSSTASATPSEGTPSGSPSSTASATPSEGTPSGSPSSTASASPSEGTPSGTPSSTASASPSEGTPSFSPSATPSEGTPSGTPSGSPSASPSPGWEGYTRGEYAVLPGDDTELTTEYSVQDYLDVDTHNEVRVGQTADDSKFTIHQFKDFVGDEPSCTLYADLQSDYAPSASTVYLQIYNYDTTAWVNVDSDSVEDADTDFVLTGDIPDLTDYKSDGIMTCRIYQENV